MKNTFRKYFLNAWPILFIFVFWFIFASPYFIKNKVPFSSTYLVNFFSPWNAYPGFGSPVKNNAMPDVISQIYPWKTFTIQSLKNLEIPLWNPYSFSGTPHLANYQSAVLSPFNLLFFILPFVDAWSLLILLQPLLAGLFTYTFLRTVNIKKEGSLIGSLSFMLCGFITTWMAYGTLGYAILFLPLALYSIEKYYQTNKNIFLILLSLSFPLSFFSGHFQISIYFLIVVILYMLFKLISTKNYKDFLMILLYSGIGIFLSLPQLIPSIELYMQSLRSGIFEKIEIIPWIYLPTFIAPDFLGNPVTRNDWFGHYAEWNAYIGLVPIMLSAYAIFRKKNIYVIFFSLIALLSVLLSFGTPLLDLLILLKVPVLSTSAASRIIVIFSFSASIMAAFGFEKLFEDIKDKNYKYINYWIATFSVIFILLWGIIMLKFFMPLDKIIIARQNFLLPTLVFAITVILLTLCILLKKRFNKNLNLIVFIQLILIFIVAFDILRFANKWMPFDPRGLVYPQIPISSEFSKISGYERILSNLGGEATTYYKLPSLEGYDAVYIKRYGEFVASLQYGDLKESARSVVLFPKNGLYTQETINLLGVKYIVHKTSDDNTPWTFPFWDYKKGIFSLIYNDGSYRVYENNNAFPRAYLANRYVVQNNPQKILNTMFSDDFNLREGIVLEKNISDKIDSNATGAAQIVSYQPNKITISVNSTGNALLFLSDTYYPGWEAYVDGMKAEIYRSDYAFRSVFVPKGVHTVVFAYFPLSFKLGIIGFVFGLILVVSIGVLRRKTT